MKFITKKEFVEEIVRLANLCFKLGGDSTEISFALDDGRTAVVEMTFRTEE